MDINAHTQFCGVIGSPVEHSLSPAIHNAAFQKLGLNFVYLASDETAWVTGGTFRIDGGMTIS